MSINMLLTNRIGIFECGVIEWSSDENNVRCVSPCAQYLQSLYDGCVLDAWRGVRGRDVIGSGYVGCASWCHSRVGV